MKNSIGKPDEGKLHVRFDEGVTDSLQNLLSFSSLTVGYQGLLYGPIEMKILFTLIIMAISGVLFAQSQADTIPPSPPAPYLLIDWNSPGIEYAVKDGFELLDIKTFPCGIKPDTALIHKFNGDTLIVSFTVETNCCRNFIGRINSKNGENLELELYTYGNDLCFCECLYTFEYYIKIKSDELKKVKRTFVFNMKEMKITGA